MAQDYGMGSLGGGDEAPASTPPETPPDKGKEDTEQTALLPKSILGKDCKVGDVISLKVVADHGEEAEVSYESSEAEPETGSSADDELDSMSKEEM